MTAPGRLIAVGLGPGAPDLLTLRAHRALGEADIVAYFAKAGRRGRARTILEGMLRPGVIELPLFYPVTTEIPKEDPAYIAALEDFYAAAAALLAAHLDAGSTVVVTSEGDPLYYGSYMHLHVRLMREYRTEVIPGVTGMSGCWSAAGQPIAQGDDVLSVLPGTLGEEELVRRLKDTDAAVVMKLGRNLPKVRRALARAGRLDRAFYVERGTMRDEKLMPLSDKTDDAAPYFSLILVPGWKVHR